MVRRLHHRNKSNPVVRTDMLPRLATPSAKSAGFSFSPAVRRVSQAISRSPLISRGIIRVGHVRVKFLVKTPGFTRPSNHCMDGAWNGKMNQAIGRNCDKLPQFGGPVGGIGSTGVPGETLAAKARMRGQSAQGRWRSGGVWYVGQTDASKLWGLFRRAVRWSGRHGNCNYRR